MAVKAFGLKPEYDAIAQSILRKEMRVHPSDPTMQPATFDGYVASARLAFARAQRHPYDDEAVDYAKKMWNESIVHSHDEES